MSPRAAKGEFDRVAEKKFKDMETRVRKIYARRGVVLEHPLPFDMWAFKDWLRSRSYEHSQDRWECAYCRHMFLIADISPEHVIPLARAGGVDFDNLTVSCARCNRQKGEFTAEEYLKLKLWFRNNLDPAAERYALLCLDSGGLGQRNRISMGARRR